MVRIALVLVALCVAVSDALAEVISCNLDREVECFLGDCQERTIVGDFTIDAAGKTARLCFVDKGKQVCTTKEVEVHQTNRGKVIQSVPEDNKSTILVLIAGTQMAMSDLFTAQISFLRFGTCFRH